MWIHSPYWTVHCLTITNNTEKAGDMHRILWRMISQSDEITSHEKPQICQQEKRWVIHTHKVYTTCQSQRQHPRQKRLHTSTLIVVLLKIIPLWVMKQYTHYHYE